MAFLLRGLAALPQIISKGTSIISKIAPVVGTVVDAIGGFLGKQQKTKQIGKTLGNFTPIIKTIGQYSSDIAALGTSPNKILRYAFNKVGVNQNLQNTILGFLNDSNTRQDYSNYQQIAQRGPKFALYNQSQQILKRRPQFADQQAYDQLKRQAFYTKQNTIKRGLQNFDQINTLSQLEQYRNKRIKYNKEVLAPPQSQYQPQLAIEQEPVYQQIQESKEPIYLEPNQGLQNYETTPLEIN